MAEYQQRPQNGKISIMYRICFSVCTSIYLKRTDSTIILRWNYPVKRMEKQENFPKLSCFAQERWRSCWWSKSVPIVKTTIDAK